MYKIATTFESMFLNLSNLSLKYLTSQKLDVFPILLV